MAQQLMVQVFPIGKPNARLEHALLFACKDKPYRLVTKLEDICAGPLLFAAHIDSAGGNAFFASIVLALRRGAHTLEGCTAALVIDADGELYTKALARDLVLAANACGCAFIGAPLVEATGALHNFEAQARVHACSRLQAYEQAVRGLFERLGHSVCIHKTGRLLTLYASNRQQSNTYALFGMIKARLSQLEIQEIQLRNGAVADCEGCTYKTCLHFSEKGGCYYGGVMVEEVYPALQHNDGLLLLCPNYNDAADANIAAFINRMTVIFRKQRFYDKPLFGVVVSGYSGGDLVAGQLVAALNMNKSFYLPPRFCMMETANDPGSIWHVEGVLERAHAFANGIAAVLTPETAVLARQATD